MVVNSPGFLPTLNYYSWYGLLFHSKFFWLPQLLQPLQFCSHYLLKLAMIRFVDLTLEMNLEMLWGKQMAPDLLASIDWYDSDSFCVNILCLVSFTFNILICHHIIRVLLWIIFNLLSSYTRSEPKVNKLVYSLLYLHIYDTILLHTGRKCQKHFTEPQMHLWNNWGWYL